MHTTSCFDADFAMAWTSKQVLYLEFLAPDTRRFIPVHFRQMDGAVWPAEHARYPFACASDRVHRLFASGQSRGFRTRWRMSRHQRCCAESRSASADRVKAVPTGQSRPPFDCVGTLHVHASMLFRDVDQRAVGIGELEAAVRAFLQQREPRRALGVEIDRLGCKADIGLRDLLEIGLEGGERRHPEADVVHARLLDACTVERGDFPRQHYHGHAAVSELIAAL